MTYELPSLPYDHGALEPVITRETMTYHHDRHHKTYADKLNEALEAAPHLKDTPLEAIFANVSVAPLGVRNNGGGYWNHDFFWKCMAPDGGAPSAELAEAIDRDFGDMDAFRAAFNNKGLTQFGSGWAWLIVGADGKLAVTSTLNQDNPLMDVVAERGAPLLTNDVWEHAYYLTYRNDRAAYLNAWWEVVDWNRVSDRFAAAQAA